MITSDDTDLDVTLEFFGGDFFFVLVSFFLGSVFGGLGVLLAFSVFFLDLQLFLGVSIVSSESEHANWSADRFNSNLVLKSKGSKIFQLLAVVQVVDNSFVLLKLIIFIITFSEHAINGGLLDLTRSIRDAFQTQVTLFLEDNLQNVFTITSNAFIFGLKDFLRSTLYNHGVVFIIIRSGNNDNHVLGELVERSS